MARQVGLSVNTNPSTFEELAQTLASAIANMRDHGGRLDELEERFRDLYRHALRQPPCYDEVTELTGHCLNAGDRLAGRAAWLLMNVLGLRVYGVHSLLWNEVNGQHSSPLIDQMAHALGRESPLTCQDLRHMSDDKKALVAVLGLRDDTICIVQTIRKDKLVDSAVNWAHAKSLFPSRVFDNPGLGGQTIRTLYKSAYVLRQAFPGVPVEAYCLVQHPIGPDFELHEIKLSKAEPDRIRLTEKTVVVDSIDFADRIRDDHEALLTLPEKLDSHLFIGVPPCRGGRTLSILASTASRQISAGELLRWREGDIMAMLEEDFGYKIPRDKIRHDLVDRMIGNGFMRKFGSDYSLTMKGVARYLYCLAKYTKRAGEDPEDVLSACMRQRDRILDRYGCL